MSLEKSLKNIVDAKGGSGFYIPLFSDLFGINVHYIVLRLLHCLQWR